ncbi:helix-hairpin-helix domain-containing protein [Ruminiclostridium cellulolyticum]|uniref:Competence protein ComEA helix-hairpin-helix repeat protein n=1 Tax=Ruminiclostridium cellulolyticum (strain ATCC 35319 / DSM 5812 / JCM 6584 / H10) TaxID=394503 RepID=B8I1C7_RUMCH|nr:helix-hairpin-helix domain-containing protein [Ruminiclostridium cellulolyticum]ACL75725.1 competence protein ComEA helix-hairpin-helix repeat protein [Ruminiclostridium cellulolyticum H10]
MEISVFGKKIFINKIPAICIIVGLLFGAGMLGFFLKQVYHPLEATIIEENTAISPKETEPAGEQVGEQTEEEKVPDIQIYVTGCVKNPGVVTIKKGQIIEDAIKNAGGATKEADLENINLAYPLTENTMLRIKAKGTAKVSNTGKTDKSAQTGKVTGEKPLKSGVDIINDSSGTDMGEKENKTADSSKTKLVNINKASQAELEELPNVGPSTAKAIIEYREQKGGFTKLTDIMKITGIKQKTFDKIKSYICID